MTTLDELISQLPELYQPVYGRASDGTSRSADSPRTAHILSIIDLVEAHFGRPLRILDLGSAQGYYCFLAAERHHHATGVDYLPINIAVSRAIHAQHPELSVDFVEADLDGVAALVAEGDFDLVLGLSILHHIVHRNGHRATAALVQQLRDNVPFGLFEMALRDEPLYWAESLPDDPRVTLAPYEFIRELDTGRRPTCPRSSDRSCTAVNLTHLSTGSSTQSCDTPRARILPQLVFTLESAATTTSRTAS